MESYAKKDMNNEKYQNNKKSPSSTLILENLHFDFNGHEKSENADLACTGRNVISYIFVIIFPAKASNEFI